jgi:hypothetical protein
MTGWRRNRVRVPALVGGVIALLCGSYFTAGWLRTKALQSLMMTTADPDVLGRVLSDSMETPTLTLESDHVSTMAGPGPLALLTIGYRSGCLGPTSTSAISRRAAAAAR